jgi:murein DD-endopeptidase MepM/ murein hydrolase activator NlpD
MVDGVKVSDKDQKMGLSERIEAFFQKVIPSRKLLIKTNGRTHFINLKSSTQVGLSTLIFCLVTWSIIAIAIVAMDSLGAGNFKEQALRDKENYQLRLVSLANDRDLQLDLSKQTQVKFEEALNHIALLQEALMDGEIRRKELTDALIYLKSKFDASRTEEKIAKNNLQQFRKAANSEFPKDSSLRFLGNMETRKETLLAKILSETALQRDVFENEAYSSRLTVKKIEREMKLIEQRNEQIFRLIEEALSVSIGPLEKMFRSAGVNPDSVIETIRKGYSGYGGHNLSFLEGNAETTFGIYDKNVEKASRILENLDELNLYRIAVEKYPFYHPIQSASRFTSGFGPRWGRMHNGTDFAAPHGTPIRSTADGIVTYVGWQSAYGRLIKIKHDFGIETRYAHLSKFRVKEGQRVSRGQHIGDMGNTGRSTGTHLHYEIRIGGKAINPMKYIKAAKNVF